MCGWVWVWVGGKVYGEREEAREGEGRRGRYGVWEVEKVSVSVSVCQPLCACVCACVCECVCECVCVSVRA